MSSISNTPNPSPIGPQTTGAVRPSGEVAVLPLEAFASIGSMQEMRSLEREARPAPLPARARNYQVTEGAPSKVGKEETNKLKKFIKKLGSKLKKIELKLQPEASARTVSNYTDDGWTTATKGLKEDYEGLKSELKEEYAGLKKSFNEGIEKFEKDHPKLSKVKKSFNENIKKFKGTKLGTLLFETIKLPFNSEITWAKRKYSLGKAILKHGSNIALSIPLAAFKKDTSYITDGLKEFGKILGRIAINIVKPDTLLKAGAALLGAAVGALAFAAIAGTAASPPGLIFIAASLTLLGVGMLGKMAIASYKAKEGEGAKAAGKALVDGTIDAVKAFSAGFVGAMTMAGLGMLGVSASVTGGIVIGDSAMDAGVDTDMSLDVDPDVDGSEATEDGVAQRSAEADKQRKQSIEMTDLS